MSVKLGDRDETTLDFLGSAEELAGYTIDTVSNEKHFAKRYRWCFGKQIIDKAVEINTLVHQANGIYALRKDDMRLRLRYDMEAISDTNGLLSLISIAKRCFKVSLEKSQTWIGMAVKEKNLLLKVREKDLKKLGELPE